MINFIKVVTLIIAVSNGSFVLGNIGTGDKDLSDSNSIFDGMEEASSKMGRRIKDDEIESNHGGGHVEDGGRGHHGGRYSCSKTCTVWDTYCSWFGGSGWGTSGQSQEQEKAMMNDGGEQHEGGFGGGGVYGGGKHGGGCMKQCHRTRNKCIKWVEVCTKEPKKKSGNIQEQEQVMNMDEVKPREPGQSPTYYYSEDGNM